MGLAWLVTQMGRALQLLLQLLGFARDQATSDQALQIQQTVTNAELEIISFTHGLAAIMAKVTATYDETIAIATALGVLADDLATGAYTVTLPTTPPAGYGGSFGSTDIDAIWSYQYPPGSGNIVGDKLVKAGRGIEFLGQDAWFPSAYCQYVGHHFDYSNFYVDPSTSPVPIIDPSTILPTDATIVAWLNRTVSGFTWTLLNGQAISYSHHVISDEWWVCTISQLEFEQWRAGLTAANVVQAPVWPGLANVTFGTGVAIADGMRIVAPMHGIEIQMTSIDPKKSWYQFDDQKSYRNIGAVTFYNDDGDYEWAQTLGFEDGIYSPKTMAIAAGCVLRVTGILSGTVWPWTINA